MSPQGARTSSFSFPERLSNYGWQLCYVAWQVCYVATVCQLCVLLRVLSMYVFLRHGAVVSRLCQRSDAARAAAAGTQPACHQDRASLRRSLFAAGACLLPSSAWPCNHAAAADVGEGAAPRPPIGGPGVLGGLGPPPGPPRPPGAPPIGIGPPPMGPPPKPDRCPAVDGVFACDRWRVSTGMEP
jgi:hypothetical protein